jgi:hypothetical protein
MEEIMVGAAIGGFLSLLEASIQKRTNHVLNQNPSAYSIPNEVMTDWLERLNRTHDTSGRIRLLMEVARWGRQWAEQSPR